MKNGSFLFYGLLGVVLMACTAVPDSTPTPIQPISAVTVAVERPIVTSTHALISITPEHQNLFIDTTEEFVITPVPTITWFLTQTPTPTYTPPPIPIPLWSLEVNLLYWISDYNVVWSPKDNEFLYDTCTRNSYEQLTEGSVVRISISNAISPFTTIAQDFICSTFGSNLGWTPDGQKILFTGLQPEDSTIPAPGNIYITNKTGQNTEILLTSQQIATKWDPVFWLWVDDHTFLYSGYGGGGHSSSALVDIQTRVRSQLAVLHVGGIAGFNSHYLVGDAGINTTSYISALAIPLEEMWAITLDLQNPSILRDEFFLNHPQPIYLSGNFAELSNTFETFAFNSMFMDWLPETSQMLVLTWDGELDLIENAPVTTHLQLWDINTASLTMLVPEGKHGRFSPNGRYLAYITSANDMFYIHLLDQTNESSILVTSSYVFQEQELINPDFSFSPDSRFFTFYTSSPNSPETLFLNLFDLNVQQMIATLPASPVWGIAWSPNSDRFIYKNEYGGLAIYRLGDGSTLPLTQTNDTRLSNPQWSFDGSYLSVTVEGENGAETAVLHIP